MAKLHRPSVCTMDCPDSCSLDVLVHDGEITRISGSTLNPTTQGFICSKISRFARRVYSEKRVLYPMRRTGEKGAGEFQRIRWEDAAGIICERLQRIRQEWGGEAILPYSYGGSNGLLGQDTIDRAFFAKLGASRLHRTFCAVPTTEAATAMYGKMPGTAFEDYVKAKFILIWGANPKVSNIHLMPFLKKAKKNGAKIAVVDPRCNFSRDEVDLHLAVLPGTDVAVALAMIDFWNKRGFLNRDFMRRNTVGFEILLERSKEFPSHVAAKIAGVDVAAIEKLATWYALHDPAVIRVGWGMERNRNGLQSVAAVLALPAMLGKFGRRGSGYTLSNSGAFSVDTSRVIDEPDWNTRVVNMSRLGAVLNEMTNPPVKALFIYNCNPAVTAPDQNAVLGGLQRKDLFTVVSEQVVTDTARYADILLPAVTFLEQSEIKKAYGAYALQLLQPVIEPRGEAKPNEEMFAYLGRTMGWTDPVFQLTTEELLKRLLSATHGFCADISPEHIERDGLVLCDFPGQAPVQFKTVFPATGDGKIHLAPQILGETPYVYHAPAGGFPLSLISPATDKMISSTLGEFNFPELYVVMHPEDAERRSLKAGRAVRVFNDLGEVVVQLRLSTSIRPGVVFMPKGAWRHASVNGATATALAPQTVSSVGGACFNDARVEVAST